MFVSTELSLPLSPNNNHNYQFKSFKDWVDFFQDTEISTNTKTEQAESYLSDLIKKLNIETLEWLDQPAQVEQHLLEQHHQIRSEEHTSELQSVKISYAVLCFKKKRPRSTP